MSETDKRGVGGETTVIGSNSFFWPTFKKITISIPKIYSYGKNKLNKC